MFDNEQDAALVAKSFRDIGVLLNVFHVNYPRLWEDSLTDGLQMDTVLSVEVKVEEIMQRLKPEGEDVTRESTLMRDHA